MYVEEREEGGFCIYANNQYFPSLDWNDKEEISQNVKKWIYKINRIYHLSLAGFYKMYIYLNPKVGMMMELKKLEDFGMDIKTIDLRIVIYLNSDFLIEVDDIDYDQNHFYGNVDVLSQEGILKVVEWGNFLYGDKVEEIKRRGKKIKTKKV